MTAEELFYDISNKYGEDFNWDMLPFSQSNGALDGIYYIFFFIYFSPFYYQILELF